jgi:hypothetical protein
MEELNCQHEIPFTKPERSVASRVSRCVRLVPSGDVVAGVADFGTLARLAVRLACALRCVEPRMV